MARALRFASNFCKLQSNNVSFMSFSLEMTASQNGIPRQKHKAVQHQDLENQAAERA
jgi:hypothetical protein